MTLLLAFANRDYSVLLSDRRLTANGRLVDDEANKATTFICDDGRFAVAFTGLARAGAFSTEDWLVDALLEAGQPDHRIGPTVERLAKLTGQALQGLRVVDKRLSIVLVGHHFGEEPPRPYCFLVSNYDALDGTPQRPAEHEFTASYLRETRPFHGEPSMIVRTRRGRSCLPTRACRSRRTPESAKAARGDSRQGATAAPRSRRHTGRSALDRKAGDEHHPSFRRESGCLARLPPDGRCSNGVRAEPRGFDE